MKNPYEEELKRLRWIKKELSNMGEMNKQSEITKLIIDQMSRGFMSKVDVATAVGIGEQLHHIGVRWHKELDESGIYKE